MSDPTTGATTPNQTIPDAAELRKRVSDLLIGNAYPTGSWGKGYAAGIVAALTAIDDYLRGKA